MPRSVLAGMDRRAADTCPSVAVCSVSVTSRARDGRLTVEELMEEDVEGAEQSVDGPPKLPSEVLLERTFLVMRRDRADPR